MGQPGQVRGRPRASRIVLDQDQTTVQRPGHYDRADVTELFGNRFAQQSRIGQRNRPEPGGGSRSNAGEMRDSVQQPITRGNQQLGH